MLLKQLPGRLISVASKDEVPKNFNISNMPVVQNLRQSQTDGILGLTRVEDQC